MGMRVDESNGGGEGCSNHNGVKVSAIAIWEEEELGLVLVNLFCLSFRSDECVKLKH